MIVPDTHNRVTLVKFSMSKLFYNLDEHTDVEFSVQHDGGNVHYFRPSVSSGYGNYTVAAFITALNNAQNWFYLSGGSYVQSATAFTWAWSSVTGKMTATFADTGSTSDTNTWVRTSSHMAQFIGAHSNGDTVYRSSASPGVMEMPHVSDMSRTHYLNVLMDKCSEDSTHVGDQSVLVRIPVARVPFGSMLTWNADNLGVHSRHLRTYNTHGRMRNPTQVNTHVKFALTADDGHDLDINGASVFITYYTWQHSNLSEMIVSALRAFAHTSQEQRLVNQAMLDAQRSHLKLAQNVDLRALSREVMNEK